MPSQIAIFFQQFAPGFQYRPSEPANSNFYRLCDLKGWKREDSERENAYQEFQNALVHQFNTNYGTDVNNLESWQKLCKQLRVKPVPDTLDEAREVSTCCCQDHEHIFTSEVESQKNAR